MTMNYELAKELEKAGFNQFGNNYSERGNRIAVFNDDKTDFAYKPTLSGLIEACGAGFLSLERSFNSHPNEWAVMGNRIKCCGSTPEKAVARLWLSLNSKK